MSVSAPARRSDAPLRGIVLMCAAVLSFVCMTTLVKYLSDTYPVPMIIWARYFFHFALILLLFPRRVPRLLESRRKWLQILRSVLVLLATLCMFTAVSLMPLADVISITFTAPLFITGLSVLVLREKVGLRRWAAVAVGFLGVLIVMRPGLGIFQWAALLALGQAALYGSYQIATRFGAGDAKPLNALFYTALVGAAAASLFVPWFWATPDLLGWFLLALTGLFGGLGHFAIIMAYDRAQAVVIAPFGYTELLWALLFGLVVFGEFPDNWTLVGAGIIAASGLYVLHRERLKKPLASAAPGPAPEA